MVSAGAGQTQTAEERGPRLVELAPDHVPWRQLSAVLQCGVGWPLSRELSVRRFLSDELGVDDTYIETQIATVILDGMVVDDLDSATVRPGSRLTLSAAMPGLVGATLRRGGYYRAMRSEISWGASAARVPGADGGAQLVHLKLFNTILRDLGQGLLARGVVLDAAAARELIGENPEEGRDLPLDGEVLLRVTPRQR